MKKIDDDVDFTETEEFADAFIDMVCGGGGNFTKKQKGMQ